MSVRSIVFLAALFVAPVLVYLFWPGDEARIRRLVKEEARAVEREDVEGFMAGISYNYSDERGLSYLLIQRLIEREFSVRSGLAVEYENLQVEVAEGRAEARLEVRVLAGEGETRGYYWGDFKDPLRFTLTLVKNPAGKWLVTGSSLKTYP